MASSGDSAPLAPAAALARELAGAALAAVEPAGLVRRALAASPARFTALLALGKAAAALAHGALDAGAVAGPCLVLRPHGAPALARPGCEELAGGHPLPDAASFAAGERLAAWLAALGAGDHLLALVSGGGSACVERPAAGLAAADVAAAQRALVGSALGIRAINGVRARLSALKGGGALRLTAARVTAWVLSDVPGDDLAAVASGPFAPDRTTAAEALAAVAGLDLPAAIAAHLAAGARGERPATFALTDPACGRLELALLGGGATAAAAAAALAGQLGYTVEHAALRGEAATAGRELVARGRALAGPRAVVVAHGETVVRLGPAPGRGGRNQELALAASERLAGGSGEAVLALASDGVDGPTDAAGACVDGATWPALVAGGADPAAALAAHDSHRALTARAGALLRTGPTGTNVADLAFYVRSAG